MSGRADDSTRRSRPGRGVLRAAAPGGGALRLAALLSAVTGVAACETAPPPLPPAEAPFTVESFAERAPMEVAILPPSLAPNFDAVDADLLRDEVYGELIEKGYTPLAPEFVDGLVASEVPRGRRSAEAIPPRIAALRALLDTDAYLFVDVLHVKVVAGADPSSYRIEARATLVEAVTGATLFEHRIPILYEVEFDGEEPAPDRLRSLLDRYAARLMAPLPARYGSG